VKTKTKPDALAWRNSDGSVVTQSECALGAYRAYIDSYDNSSQRAFHTYDVMQPRSNFPDRTRKINPYTLATHYFDVEKK
jgi:hypothetical protein